MCRYYHSASGGYIRMCYKTRQAGYHLGLERRHILPPACQKEVEAQMDSWIKAQSEGDDDDEDRFPGRTGS